jgi:hypothetical protein
MNKREYIFNEASWVLMIGVFIGTLILNTFIVKSITYPKGTMTGIFIVSFILFIPLLISRIVAFSKTKVTLTKKEIIVQRTSMIGLPIKADFKLHYSQIKQYVFQEDMNWYWLKLVDINGKKYRIWKFAIFNNVQYKKFRDRLDNEIRWYNQKIENSDNIDLNSDKTIDIAPNIYQGKLGYLLGFISVVFLIVIPLIIILTGQNISKTIAPLLIGLSGAGFTLFKVINERKEK